MTWLPPFGYQHLIFVYEVYEAFSYSIDFIVESAKFCGIKWYAYTVLFWEMNVTVRVAALCYWEIHDFIEWQLHLKKICTMIPRASSTSNSFFFQFVLVTRDSDPIFWSEVNKELKDLKCRFADEHPSMRNQADRCKLPLLHLRQKRPVRTLCRITQVVRWERC